jgi:metal-responsive CopG/Arc/MetJ family transcriptional regulator
MALAKAKSTKNYANPTSIVLPAELLEELNRIAEKERRPRTQVIELLLAEALPKTKLGR